MKRSIYNFQADDCADDSLKRNLLSELESLRTIDCHSHTLTMREYYKASPYTIFTMPGYFDAWELAPGLKNRKYGAGIQDEENWKCLKGFLKKAQNITFWRHNIMMYHLLFGLKDDELTDGNWETVNATIKKKTAGANWYDRMTRRVCNFEMQIRTVRWSEDWEKEYFTPVLWMEPALWLHVEKPWYCTNEKNSPLQDLEERSGMTVNSLKSAEKALGIVTEKYVRRGIVGIKIAHAYARSLHIAPVEEVTAAEFFNAALSGKSLKETEVKVFQDHLIYFLANLAKERNLVFQIHTGIQHLWADIPGSDPLLLAPLLKAFPEVRFDLLHAGYPHARTAGVLAKLYPNVWLNMAWMYVISTAASRTILSEYLDLVPANRILGFGSDVYFPELAYAHLVMARECVSEVLANKVEYDFWSPKEAVRVARMMFKENAIELYRLKQL